MSIDTFVIDARSIITVISLATFLGIVVWAWSGRRASAFAEAARLPFADDDAVITSGNNAAENKHG